MALIYNPDTGEFTNTEDAAVNEIKAVTFKVLQGMDGAGGGGASGNISSGVGAAGIVIVEWIE